MAERPDTHLTKGEVAAQLRVCVRTVETLMSTGQLGYHKVGRCVRIPPGAVTSYLEGVARHPEPDGPAPVRTARASARKTVRH
jgi:excisionase family DNA binding protein